MKNYILGVVLGGAVLFLWGFFSWGVLPWHNMVANEFSSEQAVAKVLKENAPAAGVYYLPFAEEWQNAGETAAFVNVLPEGLNASMGELMVTAVLGQMIAALLVLLLLRNTTGLNYLQRVAFVTLVGLTIGFVGHFPYWNWFGFSDAYVLVAIIDSMIAWTLAGFVMSAFVKGKNTLRSF